MKEWMITNVCCVTAGSIAIATACYVTKSAIPLLAFLLIPRWNWNRGGTTSDNKEDQNG